MPVSVGELIGYLRLDSSGFDRGISVAQQEMRGAAGVADKLSAAVGVTESRLVGAGREANRTAAGSAKLRAAQLSLVAAQERYNTVLAQGNATAGRLASAEAAVVRANARVTASSREATVAEMRQAVAMERVNTAAVATPGLMSRTATGFAGAGKAALGLGVAFGAFEVARKAIDITKEANSFQRDMQIVQTNAGASADEVDRASAALLKMAGPVAASPEQLAVAFYHAKSVGLDYAHALETTRIAAEGARVGNADVEETMNALTSSVASGIPGVENMSKAMGQLIAIVGTGDMKLSDLNDALGSGVLSVVKGYGLSLRDVGAALATFGDNNIRGADAATMLRMAVQAMDSPAKLGQKALAGLGFSAGDLAKDLQSGGLMKAVRDLKTHLDAAGITGDRVGHELNVIFGKKAGPGIQVMIGQIDRLEQKYAVLGKAGDSFAGKWDATTHTATVALARLGHGMEAAGIAAAEKLSPEVAGAANWLGEKLPAAIHVVQSVVGPLAHDVGTVLAGAWHVAAVILGVVGGALGEVSGFLSRHATVVHSVGRAVLVMWAAYKGFTLARAALIAIDQALGAMAMRMNRAGGAMAGMRAGMSNLSTATVAGGAALAVVGIALYAYTAASSQAAAIDARRAAEVDSLTSAIEQDSGALGKNTRAAVENMLQHNGMFQAGLKLGISQKELTDALLGNAAAMADVNAKTQVGTVESTFFAWHLKGLSGELATATQNAKDKAAADRDGSAASNAVAEAQRLAANSTRHLAAAEKDAADAAKRLDNALKALASRLSAREALDQFRSGVQQLKDQLDQHNHTLDGNSAAAVKNRLAVDQVVQSMLAYGNTLKDQGKTQPQINSALQKQAQYLIDNAKQIGLTKKQLREYLRELHLTPAQIHTLMGVDTNDALAKIRALKQWFDSLTWTAHVTANGKGVTAGPGSSSAHLAGGGTVSGPGGPKGDKIPAMLSDGEEVTPEPQASKHRSLLKAIAADRVPGYASGGTAGSKGGTLGNVHYKTQSDYQSALHAASQAIADVLAAAANVNATADQMRSAAKDLRSAAKDQKLSAQFQKDLAQGANRLNDLVRTRDQVHERLGSKPTAPTAYDQLQAAQQTLTGDRDRYASAVTGNFDVTGVTPPPGPTTATRKVGAASIVTSAPAGAKLTAAMILSADQADVSKIAEFDRLIHRLVAEGFDPDYVAQIASKGPTDEAMQTARALAASSPKQVREFNQLESGRNGRKAIGADLGNFLAKKYDQAGVDAAQGLVNGLLSQDKALTAAADHLAETLTKRLKQKLGIHSPSRVAFELAGHFADGAVNGLHHKLPSVRAAADRFGDAMTPAIGGAGVGSAHGGTSVELNVYGQPGQSPAEIAHIAAADLTFHLDR